ncbi:uncharacterized protein LOC105179308 [Sesamum indicum]|uniref:Uncharacterized protein LOC105179308 n=1 Tax=Sesamum indicum TaxID=4182 RepID=A0A6I9UR24_SESIN|nr:uncharacterized protein LOC105179308 [Sesamum indicum]
MGLCPTRRCYNLAIKQSDAAKKEKRKQELSQSEDVKGGKMERLEPNEEFKEVELIAGDFQKMTRIGSQMSKELEMLTIIFLRRNHDMFAWSPSDFKGIDPEVIVHRLNIDAQVKPMKQKKRMFRVERNKIIEEEESGAGCALSSMMDAYQGYHQIFMAKEDAEKTTFVTENGVYCYNVMPFDLNNARATYQRLVNRMFKDHIGSTMEVYVDDMSVKSKQEDDHLTHLEIVFSIMRSYGMKLNLAKCTFGVRGGKFLGYMVSERGIEVNLEKIKAIMQLGSPTSVKDVKKLTGKVASLNCFITRSADRSLPFFKVLRKIENFEWNEECGRALQDLKMYLATPPLLSSPMVGEKLYVYLAVSDDAVMSKPDTSGKMVNWAVELGEFDIELQIRNAQEKDVRWLLHVDGSSNSKNRGAGIYLQGTDGVEIEIAVRLNFPVTNNEAEYETLIQGLQTALDGGVRQLDVYTDSQLVAMQVHGVYEMREWSMMQYLAKVREMMGKFDRCALHQIPRDENARVDALSKFGAMVEGIKERKTTVMIKSIPMIDEKTIQVAANSWKIPYI